MQLVLTLTLICTVCPTYTLMQTKIPLTQHFGLFQKDIAPCQTLKTSFRNGLRNREIEVLTWLPNSPDFNLKYVLDKQVWSYCTSEFTRLKRSPYNILVPDTKAHIQGSCVVHVSMGQSCFGCTVGTWTILARLFYIFWANWCIYIVLFIKREK